MKDLKEQIIDAVQDATDTVDGTVSIPVLDHFLDGILSEQLHQPAVSGSGYISNPMPVVGSAFSDSQKKSLIHTVRFIIDHTRRYEKELSDEEIIKMIEEDFFGK